jgi:simple sugar transport system substrate-binding protein
MYKNLAAVIAAACFFSPVFAQTAPAAPATPPLKIGFLYVAPLTDAGWVQQHDQAARQSRRRWATASRPPMSRM